MSEYLQKIVYLTKSQYDQLASGTAVGGQTEIKDNYLYITSDTFGIEDITGILPVSKGGTGAGILTAGNLLVGNGTNAVTTILKDSASTANAVVVRDASKNFSAGTITATLSGNASSATRINGNLGSISSATNCNIWVSSDASASGIPKYVSGVYVTASTGVITAKGFSGPLTGNVTGSATSATNDSDGNAINSTYFKLTETRAATTSNTFSITNDTASSSTSTGALVVDGGVGIAKKLYVGSNTDIAAQTIIHNETAHSTAGKSSQLVVQNAKNESGNYVAIELLRGSALGTTYTSWQIAVENSGDLHIRNNYNAAGTGLETTYAKDLLYIDRAHGTLRIGDLSIGGESGTTLGRTISSSNVLYLNRPAANSLVFSHGGTAKIRIDPSNAFRPETTDTLSIGTSTYKWNAIYATTYYGALQSRAETNDLARHVWFAYSTDGSAEDEGVLGKDDDFEYNPSTNVLTVGKLTITGGTANSSLSTTGSLSISSASSKTMTINSGSTMYLQRTGTASIIFCSGGTATANFHGRFNASGNLALETGTNNAGTQNTHKFYVKGDSAFEGKIAFATAASNAITTQAYMQYNSTDLSIDFVFA